MAALVARHEVRERARGFINPAKKQNVGGPGDDRVGIKIGMHTAVVEFHPLLAVVWAAVRVIMAATVPAKKQMLSSMTSANPKTKQHISPAGVIGDRV